MSPHDFRRIALAHDLLARRPLARPSIPLAPEAARTPAPAPAGLRTAPPALPSAAPVRAAPSRAARPAADAAQVM
jgi:hypothetical protein